MRRFGEFLGEVTVEGPVFTYPLSLALAERMAAPRMALLGDAAHGVHPIAGQGLNLGLKDAAALSQVLVEASRLGEDIGSLAVLERYAAWRRFDNVMLSAAHGRLRLAVPNDNSPAAVRARRGAWRSSTDRPGPAVLHAGSRRRGRAIAAAAARRRERSLSSTRPSPSSRASSGSITGTPSRMG